MQRRVLPRDRHRHAGRRRRYQRRRNRRRMKLVLRWRSGLCGWRATSRSNSSRSAARRRRPAAVMRVVAGAPVVVRHPPLGLHPAVQQQPLQRRVERALADQEHLVRGGAQMLGDAVAVRLAAHERLQDQQIERAGQEIGRLVDRLPSFVDGSIGPPPRAVKPHRQTMGVAAGAQSAFSTSFIRCWAPSKPSHGPSSYSRAKRPL